MGGRPLCPHEIAPAHEFWQCQALGMGAKIKRHGLVEMNMLKAAVIPVDQKMAANKNWGHTPLDTIVEPLKTMVPAGWFLRTDMDPRQPGRGIVVDKDYFEVPF
jgi:hypothetical protein